MNRKPLYSEKELPNKYYVPLIIFIQKDIYIVI